MKRGAGHIEVIISMVLFIGFVMFVFYFFNPIKSSRIVDSSLPYLFSEINENLNVELETYSVKVDENIGLNDVLAVELSPETLDSKKVRVEDYYETKRLESRYSGNTVYIKPEGEDFILIKICEDFEDYQDDTGDAQYGEGDYVISYVGTREIFSEKKAEELNQKYLEDYESLRSEFNLGRTNFGFSLVFSDSQVRAEKFIPAGTDVFSEYRRKEVLRESGELEFADLIAMVW